MVVLSEFIENEYKIITVKIPKDSTLKVIREKRSQNANSYFWVLLQQLCEEMNIDVIKEYRKRVKELGIFRQWEIESKNVDTFKKMWESKGIAWFIEIVDTTIKEEKEYKIINAYYGSSSYNSKQMSKLIESLVEDCKEIGIETLTKEQIISLLGD